jgi:hypothetical protein
MIFGRCFLCQVEDDLREWKTSRGGSIDVCYPCLTGRPRRTNSPEPVAITVAKILIAPLAVVAAPVLLLLALCHFIGSLAWETIEDWRRGTNHHQR